MSGAPAYAANGETNKVSVERWLDDIQPGFADRFGAAFHDIGVETVADVSFVGDGELASLKEALVTAGCKGAMFNRLRAAIENVGETQKDAEAAAVPSATATSPLAAQAMDRGGGSACSWPLRAPPPSASRSKSAPPVPVAAQSSVTTPADFRIPLQHTFGMCDGDSTLVFPSYVARQWGGRVTKAQYQRFVRETNEAATGMIVGNGVCKATIFGCYLCLPVALCELCLTGEGMERAKEQVQKFDPIAPGVRISLYYTKPFYHIHLDVRFEY